MTARAVAAVLRRLHLPDDGGPQGFLFALSRSDDNVGAWRIERGGGIAGHLGQWWLRRVGSSDVRGPATNARALRRLLVELLAGPRPTEQPGHALHAKLNHNRFGDSFVWCYRKAPADGGPVVAAH